MKNRRILISGAGIAGPSLAYWLQRYGFEPTLLECGPSLRLGGFPVDIRGAALQVIDKMGLHATIAEKHTAMRGGIIIDHNGNQTTELEGDTFGFRAEGDLEIMRGTLCQILIDHIKGVECIFDDSIKSLHETPTSVDVEFEKSIPRTFDLVVGADGLHSNVRNLIFGPEEQFLKYLGLYITIFTIPNYLNLDRWGIEYVHHKMWASISCSKGETDAKAGCTFSSKPLKFDPRNPQEQKQLVINACKGHAWEFPRILDYMKETPDFYFDSISQIHMNCWSKGRTVLLGDAGYCGSPVSGQGTSLALVGAYHLAGELAEASGEHTIAFPRYENLMRHFVKQNQKIGQTFAKSMTKDSWIQVQLKRLLPTRWFNIFTNLMVRRITKAANSITLKDYSSS